VQRVSRAGVYPAHQVDSVLGGRDPYNASLFRQHDTDPVSGAVAFFRRSSQPTPGTFPGIPAPEQRLLIRESDRRNYTSHGYRALNSYAFAKDIVPGKLWGLILDQLTDRDPPERSAVLVGVHDVDLERGVATVLGEKYRKSMGTLGRLLPFSGKNTLEERQLKAVLLFFNDGEQAERRRVERVVALAQEYAQQFPNVDALRRRVVHQLSGERLATGHRVRLGLAAAWTGEYEIADRMAEELTALCPAPAMERLRELQARHP